MPRGTRISDDQRSTVLTLIRSGRGRNQIARDTGISQGTVTAIARSAGVEITPAGIDRAALNKLLEAARVYDRERRLRLFYRSMERAEEMLASPDLTPRGLQAVVLSQAVATDKVGHLLGEAPPEPQGQRPTVIVYVPSNGRAELPPPEVTAVEVEVQGRYLPAGDSEEETGQ